MYYSLNINYIIKVYILTIKRLFLYQHYNIIHRYPKSEEYFNNNLKLW